MWQAVGNENCVIWPSSADRFLSPSPPPSLSLLFISSSSRLWRSWHVAIGGGKDGSSAQCKSLPPGKPASDARPHGPLTCCLCDLWRLGASGQCRLLSSLSSVSLHTQHRTARSHTHCTTVCRSIQKGIPRTCWVAVGVHAHIHPQAGSLLCTLSHTKINTPINISALQHRVPQSHHMSIRLSSLSEYSPFDCAWITFSHGVSALKPWYRCRSGAEANQWKSAE